MRKFMFVKEEDMIRLVREHYRSDSTNPPKEFTRELRLAVCETLGLPEDQLDQVHVYSSLHTPLDVLCGVDAFVVYGPRKGDERIVTLDASLRPDKDEYKADIIVPDMAIPSMRKIVF